MKIKRHKMRYMLKKAQKIRPGKWRAHGVRFLNCSGCGVSTRKVIYNEVTIDIGISCMIIMLTSATHTLKQYRLV